MALNIKTILYATDLSENARYAFGYANDLARKYDAQLTILYVVENINETVEVQISEMIGYEKWSKIKQEKQKDLIKQIRSKVEDFCHEMDAEHDSCRLVIEDVKIKKGNPCEEILKVSKEIDADLIVIGSHGYSLLKDVFMGSTARKVVQQSEKPVLTIKLP